MAKNFSDLLGTDPKNMTKDQAMVYIINFFNSRMNAMNKASITKAKELINIHQIDTYELVEKYIDLVHKNS
jgi:hypothetical protein